MFENSFGVCEKDMMRLYFLRVADHAYSGQKNFSISVDFKTFSFFWSAKSKPQKIQKLALNFRELYAHAIYPSKNTFGYVLFTKHQ
jgi:hypothetical protein